MENRRGGPRRRAGRVLSGALCVLVVLAGCAPAPPDDDSAGLAPSAPEPTPSAGEIYAACAPPGMVDYDPIESLAVLAGDSTVVITGEIDRIQAGRTVTFGAANQTSTTQTAVIVVRAVTVMHGELDPAASGSVYIEFASGSLDVCARTVPVGTAIVAYLEPSWDGARSQVDEEPTSEYTEIEEPGAGRPDGQPLYRAAALEGLVWQPPGSRELIWPLYLGTGVGDIRETLPDGTLAGPP